MSHLLRICLPDVPGSLGAVASALGRAGVNIDAIEIVEHRGDGSAVDDVFIRLLPGVMPDAAVSAVTRLDGVEVLWVSRYPSGNLHLDLEAVELVAEQPGNALEVLVDVLPSVFRGDWAMAVVRRDDAVVRPHATSAAPDLLPQCRDWLPLESAARLAAPDAWSATALAAAPVGSPNCAVVLGRHGGPDILDSELARMSLLATLAASIRQGPQ